LLNTEVALQTQSDRVIFLLHCNALEAVRILFQLVKVSLLQMALVFIDEKTVQIVAQSA
jgi:hypothetical protein